MIKTNPTAKVQLECNICNYNFNKTILITKCMLGSEAVLVAIAEKFKSQIYVDEVCADDFSYNIDFGRKNFKN